MLRGQLRNVERLCHWDNADFRFCRDTRRFGCPAVLLCGAMPAWTRWDAVRDLCRWNLLGQLLCLLLRKSLPCWHIRYRWKQDHRRLQAMRSWHT